jgi:cellulose synthase/poly-beta-1,6-N-acetylglucosamine synthase-like glycosyltransferase
MSALLENVVLLVYFLALTVLFIFGANGFLMVYYYKKYRPVKGHQRASRRRFPKVTVQLPIYNEYYVVERLIKAACALKYPKKHLEIQVLDDSNDETVEVSRRWVQYFCEQGFDIVLLPRSERRGYKAGALREGLAVAKGEFIAIFDADFVPPKDFLRKTLPYFKEAQVGMVQTRWGHINNDYSLLTRSQAIGLDGHFVVEQAARHRAGFFINFNGTAGVWRKACIEDSGNWQDDTLTEDLDLSYRAQLRGWKFKYLKDTICRSEIPSDIAGVKSQQFRWTKGAIETAKKILPQVWRSRLPLGVKLQSTVHLTNNLVFPFILIVALLSLPLVLIKNGGKDHSFYFAVSSAFVIAFFGSFWMYLTSQKEAYPDWRRRLWYFPVFMAGSMGLSFNNTRAILLGLFNKRSEFLRTPKYRIESGDDHFAGKRYHRRALFAGIWEALLAIYCLITIGVVMYHAEYAALPFQTLFCFGYGFIATLSLKHSLWPEVRQFFSKEMFFLNRAKGALQSN